MLRLDGKYGSRECNLPEWAAKGSPLGYMEVYYQPEILSRSPPSVGCARHAIQMGEKVSIQSS